MANTNPEIHKIAERRVNLKIAASILLLLNLMLWAMGIVGYDALQVPRLYYFIAFSSICVVILIVMYLKAYKPFNKSIHSKEIEDQIAEEELHV